MIKFARLSEGEPFKPPLDIQRPFSNFSFIDRHFSTTGCLRRIMSQVRRHGGKTMVFEKLDVTKALDLSEENEDIRLRVPSFKSSKAFRLSFFNKSFNTLNALDSVKPSDIIGYAIVKKDELPDKVDEHPVNGIRIYESVIRGSERPNNFIRGAQKWKFSVNGFPLEVNGYLYAQQNALTNCCAHVALRTVAAGFHRAGDMTYREMNQLSGINKGEIEGLPDGLPAIDHINRKISVHGGLCPIEMAHILDAIGAKCFRMEYMDVQNPLTPPFENYLYGSLESGYPAIVGFESGPEQHHAIPVFGHTFNEDTWVPSAERTYFRIGEKTVYIPSHSWLSTFIGHDDNHGSNFCIPRHFLRTRPACDKVEKPEVVPCKRESRCVAYVIGTFPGTVKVDSAEAEAMGVDYLEPLLKQLLEQGQEWLKRLRAYFKGAFSVFRPVLIDSQQYIKHLGLVTDWEGNKIAKADIRAIDNIFQEYKLNHLWMIELSVPNLFEGNRRKIAEVLITAEIEADPDHRFDNYIMARLPGWFAFLKNVDGSGPRFMFRSSIVKSHVELYLCEETRK